MIDILLSLLGGIIIGALLFKEDEKSAYIKCAKTIKKHKDIVNWLKSDLASAKKKKLGHRIDQNKVKLLQVLITRLEK